MNTRHLQMLLAASGDYAGGIDGNFGPKSQAARSAVEARHRDKYTFTPSSNNEARRQVAAGQACLDQLGFEPGLVDGWAGVNTTEALNAFLFKTTNGKDEVIDRTPVDSDLGDPGIPKQSQCDAVYGRPGNEIASRLVMIELPFKLRIDYNLRAKTNRIRAHKDAAPGLEAALIEVHRQYGIEKMQALGIDRYGGAYNHRKMRGGSKWSMHAYGVAIDFYAELNGLRTKCPEALFCNPEYKRFLDIMEDHEWLPALRLWGKDGMHFQRARLG